MEVNTLHKVNVQVTAARNCIKADKNKTVEIAVSKSILPYIFIRFWHKIIGRCCYTLKHTNIDFPR